MNKKHFVSDSLCSMTRRQNMEEFFDEWDSVERMHPWGVSALSPFLRGFGISDAMCMEVDELIFIDLMIMSLSTSRYIKVEGKSSRVVFWIVVVIRHPMMIASFADNPLAPVQRSLVVAATPSLIIACILAFFHWKINSKARCGRIDMQTTTKHARVQ